MKPQTIPETLAYLLTTKRPAGTEQTTATLLLGNSAEQINDLQGQPMAWVVVTDPDSKTLFSCHLDTVHRTAGRQQITLQDGVITTVDGECLGADDGAGVWLLLEMIEAGVPGSFVFTCSEEKGGAGAKYLADNYAEWLSGFSRAVAFDRRGVDSVITHQGMRRCASDTFASALADRLNDSLGESGFYCPDDTGIYTDTAEWTHLIPECTNLSVAYDSEHTSRESLDLTHLLALRDACCTIDWDSLPVARDKNEVEAPHSWYTKPYKVETYLDLDEDDLYAMRYKDIKAWVKANPESAAELLEDFAYRLVEGRGCAPEYELNWGTEQ